MLYTRVVVVANGRVFYINCIRQWVCSCIDCCDTSHTRTCSAWEKVASLEQTQNCASAKLESDKDNKLFNLFVSGADYHGNRSYVFSWVRTHLLF